MVTCPIDLDSNGYEVDEGSAVASVALDGGASRFRSDKLNPASTIPVQWTTDAAGYDALRIFYAAITSGADPFFINLVFEQSAPLQYTAHILPGTWKLASQKGSTYVVQATLEVTPVGVPIVVPIVAMFSKQTLVIVALVAHVANFDASLGQVFELLLNADCTGSTFVNGVKPLFYTFAIKQDGVGNRIFTWPVNVVGGGVVNPAANSTSTQTFYYGSDNLLHPVGPMMYS